LAGCAKEPMMVKRVAPDRLVLNVPSAWPPAVQPSIQPTPVTFRTFVTGTSMPPNVLILDEVTKDGVLIAQGIAELRDNGVGADMLAGDGFYAAIIGVGDPQETEKFYRLRADHLGKTVTSAILAFPVSNLPLAPRPVAAGPLVGPNSARFFTNELLLVAVPGTSPRRIREIVQKVSGTQDSPASGARITHFLPSLDVYVVEFEGGGSAEAVQRAIKAFLPYEGVAGTSPNFEIINAQPDITDPLYPKSDSSPWQWYMPFIAQGAAWEVSATGSPSVKVSVIDDGIQESHADLSGQLATFSGSVCGVSTASAHGTWVAGLIAAKANNIDAAGNSIGIVGVAPNAQILNCAKSSSGQSRTDLASIAVTEALAADGVKIFNISWEATPSDTLKTAVCKAICAGRLVVAAAGNRLQSCTPIVRFPAAYNTDERCSCSGPSFAITAFADAGDGKVAVTSNGHGLGPADEISITGTNNYNGTFSIVGVAPNTFDIQAPWQGDDGKGSWVKNPKMKNAILAVGALDDQGRVAWNMDTGTTFNCSNHGPWIDMYAPGKTILTTHSMDTNNDGILNDHLVKGGTSLAAAITSGAAAVVWALHPTWTNSEVEDRLWLKADPLDLTLDYSSHPYFGSKPSELTQRLTGKRLNLGKAVNRPPNLSMISDQTLNEDDALTITLTASDPDGDSLTFQQPANLPAFATLNDNGNGTATLSIAPKTTDAGTHGSITFVVADDGDPQRNDSKTMTITVNAPPPPVQ
jgi:hypothetical protein